MGRNIKLINWFRQENKIRINSLLLINLSVTNLLRVAFGEKGRLSDIEAKTIFKKKKIIIKQEFSHFLLLPLFLNLFDLCFCFKTYRLFQIKYG